jgi:hypothetical protein
VSGGDGEKVVRQRKKKSQAKQTSSQLNINSGEKFFSTGNKSGWGKNGMKDTTTAAHTPHIDTNRARVCE